MLVSIASLRHPTYMQKPVELRKPGQSITEYVTSELNARAEYVRRKIRIAAEAATKDKTGAGYLFFTLPELFWNIPWSEVNSEEELQELTTAYLNKVSESVSSLVEDLPTERLKVVVLAGSCATLIKVGEGESSYHEAVNYMLVVTNKDFDMNTPTVSMWPRRHVSGIDFGPHVGYEAGFWSFKLSRDFIVKVRETSSVSADYSDGYGYYEDYFTNELVDRCPFGINLSLDYEQVKKGQRDEEIENPEVKLDFLIACGMPFSDYRKYPLSVQYAIRNDGMGNGECEVVKVENGVIGADVPALEIDGNIYLSEVRIVGR